MGSQASSLRAAVQAEGKPRYWFRDGFFLTNDKSYIDPAVVNDAFGSDLMWWNDPLEPPVMRKMLDSCLTFGVYAVDETEEQMKSPSLSAVSRPQLTNEQKRARPSTGPASRWQASHAS